MKSFLNCFLIILTISLLGCADAQKDSCETDKTNGNWDDMVNNSDCSRTEKAEAYLALGGFDYYEFIKTDDPNVASILGLAASNWETKKSYFDAAASETSRMSNGTQKTIYLLASFLALYTYMEGKLDNCDSCSSTSFDGSIEDDELDNYLGSGIDSSSDSSQTDLVTTQYYQLKVNNNSQMYLVDSSADIYYKDDKSDGDSSGDTALTVPEAASLAADISSDGLSEANQVVYMNALADPFENISSVSTSNLVTFAETLLDYINNIKSAMTALGVDASHDTVVSIEEFRADIDNGGQCDSVKNSDAILLADYFADSFQETELSDYSSANLLATAKLETFNIDATYDSSGYASTYGLDKVGIKALFLNNTGSGYLAYWADSTDDVKNTMEVFSGFGTGVQKDDGEIALSEILCLSDLMSKDN